MKTTMYVTKDDVKAYLDTKEMHECIGHSIDADDCLISAVLCWKYPSYIWMVSPSVAYGYGQGHVADVQLAIPSGITELIKAFDHMADDYQPVTKEMFFHHLKEIYGDA